MKQLLVSLTAILSLTATTNTFAAMNAETIKCSKAIASLSAKLQKTVYAKTRACFLGMQKCGTDVACNDKLFYIDPVRGAKGKCAIGKLDNTIYFGDGISADLMEFMDSRNGKLNNAAEKFVIALLAACDNPAVVYGGPDGLPLIAPFASHPTDALELADQVNSNTQYGAACKGIIQIRNEFTSFQNIVDVSYGNSTSGDNLAATPGSFVYDNVTTCQ